MFGHCIFLHFVLNFDQISPEESRPLLFRVANDSISSPLVLLFCPPLYGAGFIHRVVYGGSGYAVVSCDHKIDGYGLSGQFLCVHCPDSGRYPAIRYGCHPGGLASAGLVPDPLDRSRCGRLFRIPGYPDRSSLGRDPCHGIILESVHG